MRVKQVINSRLLKSSLVYTLCDGINKAVPFLILPVLSYYLSPSDYGIITNFNVLLAVFVIFITLGVDGIVGVYFYRTSKNEFSKFIFNGFFLMLMSTILLLFLSYVFRSYIHEFINIPHFYIILLIITGFFTSVTTVNMSLWRLEEKPMMFGIYQISQTVINISLSLLFVIFFKLGWIGRVDGILIATNTFGIFSLIILVKREYLKFNYDRAFINKILMFGLPLIPHALSFWLRSGVDRILITKFEDNFATGLYATGFQFGVMISFLTMSFNNAFVPFIYKKLSEQSEAKLHENKLQLVRISKYCFLGFTIASVIFLLISNLMLDHFFSTQFKESKSYIFWAILSQLFQGYYLLFVNYIFFVKKTKQLAMITFTCSASQVILSWFLIQKYGGIGAAYSTVGISLVNFIVVVLYSNKVYPMPWIKVESKFVNYD